MHLERSCVYPRRKADVSTPSRRKQTSHFRRKNVAIAVLPTKAMARSKFGQAVSVKRGGVKITYAGVPRRLEHLIRVRIRHRAKEVSNLGRAITKGSNVQFGTTKFTSFEWLHLMFLSSLYVLFIRPWACTRAVSLKPFEAACCCSIGAAISSSPASY